MPSTHPQQSRTSLVPSAQRILPLRRQRWRKGRATPCCLSPSPPSPPRTRARVLPRLPTLSQRTPLVLPSTRTDRPPQVDSQCLPPPTLPREDLRNVLSRLGSHRPPEQVNSPPLPSSRAEEPSRRPTWLPSLSPPSRTTPTSPLPSTSVETQQRGRKSQTTIPSCLRCTSSAARRRRQQAGGDRRDRWQELSLSLG